MAKDDNSAAPMAWERGELAIDKDLSMQVWQQQQQAQEEALNSRKTWQEELELLELCIETAQL